MIKQRHKLWDPHNRSYVTGNLFMKTSRTTEFSEEIKIPILSKITSKTVVAALFEYFYGVPFVSKFLWHGMDKNRFDVCKN